MSPQRLGFLVCLLAVFCLGFTSPAQSGSVTVNMSPVALSDPLVSTLLSSSLGGWDPASLPNNLAARTAGGLVYDSTGQAFSSMLSASTIFPPFGFFSLLEMYSGAPLYSPSQVAGGWFMKSPVNEDIFDVNGNVKVDSLVVQMNGLNLLQVMDPTTFVVAPMTPALGFPAASLNVTYPYQNPFSNPWLYAYPLRGAGVGPSNGQEYWAGLVVAQYLSDFSSFPSFSDNNFVALISPVPGSFLLLATGLFGFFTFGVLRRRRGFPCSPGSSAAKGPH